MATHEENLAKLKQLTDTGQIAEATKLIDEMSAEANAARDAAAEASAPPPPPRSPDEIVLELFKSIGSHLGNKATFVELIAELENSFKSSKA